MTDTAHSIQASLVVFFKRSARVLSIGSSTNRSEQSALPVLFPDSDHLDRKWVHQFVRIGWTAFQNTLIILLSAGSQWYVLYGRSSYVASVGTRRQPRVDDGGKWSRWLSTLLSIQTVAVGSDAFSVDHIVALIVISPGCLLSIMLLQFSPYMTSAIISQPRSSTE